MKLTIIADDKRVGVDNEFFEPIDLSALDPTIHAVQWYGEYGEIEFKTRFEDGVLVRPENVFITDISPYQFVWGLWQEAKEAAIRNAPPTPASGNIPVTEA